MRDDAVARRLGDSALGRQVAVRLEQLAMAARRVFGMPDYQAYVRHCRACHPERSVPSEREFFDQYLQSRYGGGLNRCC